MTRPVDGAKLLELEDITFAAVMRASGGPLDYVRKARTGRWPIWLAAQYATESTARALSPQPRDDHDRKLHG